MTADMAIEVTVTFPLGEKGPLQEDVAATTPVGEVLVQAKKHFGAVDEPNVTWYLTARGEKQDVNRTVGQVAGEAKAVHFRLVKEITQG
ncbi:MAG: hypothetical protein M0027_00070 [Candidatus Dormibacteraeota bacterium]|jgi:hypothetical protein|nr:hypothetical protein [Candidatus Dormibacteraeota bacterium]